MPNEDSEPSAESIAAGVKAFQERTAFWAPELLSSKDHLEELVATIYLAMQRRPLVEFNQEDYEAVSEFFSYGATRGNHSWTRERGEGTGDPPGPLTPHINRMGEFVRRMYEGGKNGNKD